MDYGQILKSVRDISKYMSLYLAEIPLASEMQDILERNDWRDELKRRNFNDFSQTLATKEVDEIENIDNKLMPPPLVMPVNIKKVKIERKTSQRSKLKVSSDVNSNTIARHNPLLNAKSKIFIENIETAAVDETVETGGTFNRNQNEDVTAKIDSVSEIEADDPQISVTQEDCVVNELNETMKIKKNRPQSSMESVYKKAQEEVGPDTNNVGVNCNETIPTILIDKEKSPSSSGTFIVERPSSSNSSSNVKPINSNLVVQEKQFFNYTSQIKSKIVNFEKLASNSKIPQTKSLKNAQPMVSKNVEKTKNQLLNAKMATPSNSASKIVASITTSSQKKRDLTISKKLTCSAQMRIDAVEARKKKAAILQAHADENRQKRGEMQTRAQKMREVQESIKQKELVKAEKLKVQKIQNRNLEEKRTREEKTKHSEFERQEVISKIENIEGTKEHVQKMDNDTPIYMSEVMPPLPTLYYDEYKDWAFDQTDILDVEERLDELPYIPRKIVNTAFFLQPMTPNLANIFPSIKEKKLQRNSSAVWDKLPDFSKFDIEAALSEDDEENDY